MALSKTLVSEFVKLTDDSSTNTSSNIALYGTAVVTGSKTYVKIDGSDINTPASATSTVKDGQRVIVTIQNHTAIITGNLSDPSASGDTVTQIDSKITEMDTLIADKATIGELNAVKANVNTLTADNATIKERLTASEIVTDELKAKDVTIEGNLSAATAKIDKLESTKIDATEIEAKYATITNLNAANAKIDDLTAADVTITGRLDANDASIKNLEATKLSTTDAELKYANIDFTNIGQAAMEYFYSKSGLIQNVVVGDQTITGNLVGVTISGDLIEGNTIKAEKLVIKGSDGLYYKLNTDGVSTTAEQTDYNSLNGTVLQAKSVTAEKISVKDLVAFDATIGGFKITDTSLYSGVKFSVGNTTRGSYLDSDGQIAIGDASNYIKYYKDTDGKYKLKISADSFELSSGNVLNGVEKIEVYYATGSSGTIPPTDSDLITDDGESITINTGEALFESGWWHEEIPEVAPGEYLWTKTVYILTDGTVSNPTYTCSRQGVDGSKGDQGIPGTNGSDGKTSYLHVAYANSADGKDGFDVSDGANKLYIGQYTDFIQSDSTDYTKYSWTLIKGADGESVTIISTEVAYALGNDPTAPPVDAIIDNNNNPLVDENGESLFSNDCWVTDIPDITDAPYLWTQTTVTYSDGTSTVTYSVVRQGVDAEELTTRIESAEASIKENSDSIALRATKTEVTEAVNSGVTVAKEYSDSQLKVESESILSTVKNTYATSESLTTLSSSVEQNANSISSMVTSISDNASSISSLQQTATSFEARISANTTAADDARKVATNYLKFDSSGLCIGDQTVTTTTAADGTVIETPNLTGNTLVNSSGMYIRNKDTVLASFESTAIKLGQNTTSSVIQLCSDKGRIYYGNSFISGENNTSNMLQIRTNDSTAMINVVSAKGINLYHGSNADGVVSTSDSFAYLKMETNSSSQKCLTIGVQNTSTATNRLRFTRGQFELYSGGSADGGASITGNTSHNLHLYAIGGRVYIHPLLSDSTISQSPYYIPNDTVNMYGWYAGTLTGNGRMIHFTVPLKKPTIGIGSVSVTKSSFYVVIRQNAKYLWGTSDSDGGKKTVYAVTAVLRDNGVTINAELYKDGGTVPDVMDKYATNNAPISIGITSGTISFSY